MGLELDAPGNSGRIHIRVFPNEGKKAGVLATNRWESVTAMNPLGLPVCPTWEFRSHNPKKSLGESHIGVPSKRPHW